MELICPELGFKRVVLVAGILGLVILGASLISNTKPCVHRAEGMPVGSTQDGIIVKTSGGDIVQGIPIGSTQDGKGIMVKTEKCNTPQ